MGDANPDTKNESPNEQAIGLRRLLPILVGVLLGIVLAVYLVQRIYGDPTPPLTAELLKQAEAKWRDAGIRDYDIEIEVQSRQRETYAVKVRDGEPPLEHGRNRRSHSCMGGEPGG